MHATRFALAALLCAPAAALAQTVTSSFAVRFTSGTVAVKIGQKLCNPDQSIDFRYDLGVVPTPGVDTIEAWIVKDSGTCSTTPGSPASPSQQLSVPSQTSQTGTLILRPRIGELLLSSTDFPGGCQNTTSRASAPFVEFFCLRRKTASVFGGNPTISSATLQINFALLPPNPPSKPIVTPGDSHLRLDWTSNDSGDRTYDAYVVDQFTDPTTIDTIRYAAHDVSTTFADVDRDSSGTSLRNGKIYDTYVRSVDEYGNASALSPKTAASPVRIDDFYSRYRSENGSALGGGGCATGGSAGLLAAAAFALAFFRRRGKVGAGAAVLLLAFAPAARADWTGLDRQLRRWLVGFKIDRYDPQIDSEKGLTGAPYHEIFHGRAPLRYQLEVDYQVLHPFGAVLVGLTAGYWQNAGKGIYGSDYIDPETGVQHKKGEPSGDTARLDVVPFGAIVTYRMDWFADRYRWLPVIPYVQAGLQAALWASYSGNGNISRPAAGGRGSGWSYGYTTALGVALDLNAIDWNLAREAYVDTGLQRTALFAEYGWTRLNNFGKSGRLILSDRAWRFGLSIEF